MQIKRESPQQTPDVAAVAAAIDKMGFLFSGTDGATTTDPVVMRQLMLDCGIPESINHQALDALRSKEIPFGPLREKIIQGIVNNPPLAAALVKSAAEGVKYGQEHRLEEAIHYTILIEVITTLMVNNREFADEFQDKLMRERGPDPGNCKKLFETVKRQTGDTFAAVKTISIEPGIWRMRCWREHNNKPTKEQVEDFIKLHQLTGTNALNCRDQYEMDQGNKEDNLSGLQINILEAIFTEMHVDVSGSKGNRRTGAALIQYANCLRGDEAGTTMAAGHALPVTVGKLPPSKAPSYVDSGSFWEHLYRERSEGNQVSTLKGLSDEWAKSYTSWNARFVMTKFYPVSAFVLPKLFIPSVLSANPEQYMATRLYSLWLTLNFMNSMVQKRGMQPELASTDRPEGYDKFLRIWGEENDTYAATTLLPSKDLSTNDLDRFWDNVFEPCEGTNSANLAKGFAALALAANDGVRISREDPSFLKKYGGRSAFVILLGIALIIAGGATFGASAVAGIGLLAAGGFFTVAPVGAGFAYNSTRKKEASVDEPTESPTDDIKPAASVVEPDESPADDIEPEASVVEPDESPADDRDVESEAFAEEDDLVVGGPKSQAVLPDNWDDEETFRPEPSWDDEETFRPEPSAEPPTGNNNKTADFRAKLIEFRGAQSEELEETATPPSPSA